MTASKHEHKWNVKTLICVSCGTTYRDAWNDWAKRYGDSSQRQIEMPPITQPERGVKA